MEGSGGGPERRASGAIDSAEGVDSLAAAGGLSLTRAELALAADEARNSEIGCQADLPSSHARSARLKVPFAIFSRMADSEKRPAYCPLR